MSFDIFFHRGAPSRNDIILAPTSLNNKNHLFISFFFIFFFFMTRGKAISPYIRAKIRERRSSGAKIHELMKEFQVSRQTVQRACKKPESKPKLRGRPYILSSSDRRRLAAQSRTHPTETAKQLAERLRISASECTIHRELNAKNFSSVRVRKTPQIPEAAIAKRLAFAREYLHKGNEFWKKVIFSDEKKWELKGNDGYVRVWRENANDYTFETNARHHPGIMVWGAICANGARYTQRIKPKMNASAYQNLLAQEVFDLDLANLPADFVFQQDNASIHNARSTMDFFRDHEIPVLTWPPYSPDLNIIENMWGLVSQKIYEGGREFKTSQELWDCVSHHFLSISDEVVGRLFQSMTDHLISVIANHGKRTCY